MALFVIHPSDIVEGRAFTGTAESWDDMSQDDDPVEEVPPLQAWGEFEHLNFPDPRTLRSLSNSTTGSGPYGVRPGRVSGFPPKC